MLKGSIMVYSTSKFLKLNRFVTYKYIFLECSYNKDNTAVYSECQPSKSLKTINKTRKRANISVSKKRIYRKQLSRVLNEGSNEVTAPQQNCLPHIFNDFIESIPTPEGMSL